MKVIFIVRFKRAGAFVVFEGFLQVAEPVVADAEPNAGNEGAAIGGRKGVIRRGLIDGEFKPKDSLFPIFFFDVEQADVATNFWARRSEVKAFEQGSDLCGAVSDLAVAKSEGAASADFIFDPAVAEQKIFEHGGGGIVQPAVGQLPSEIIFLPFVRHRTVGEGMGEDKQVSAAPIVVAAQVCYGDIVFFGIGIDTDGFMDGAFPEEMGGASEDAFAVEEGCDVPVFVEGGIVAEEIGVDGVIQRSFQADKFLLIVGGDDIVGIQPEDIIARRQRKGIIASGGEVEVPSVVKDFSAAAFRDADSIIG